MKKVAIIFIMLVSLVSCGEPPLTVKYRLEYLKVGDTTKIEYKELFQAYYLTISNDTITIEYPSEIWGNSFYYKRTETNFPKRKLRVEGDSVIVSTRELKGLYIVDLYTESTELVYRRM